MSSRNNTTCDITFTSCCSMLAGDELTANQEKPLNSCLFSAPNRHQEHSLFLYPQTTSSPIFQNRRGSVMKLKLLQIKETTEKQQKKSFRLACRILFLSSVQLFSRLDFDDRMWNISSLIFSKNCVRLNLHINGKEVLRCFECGWVMEFELKKYKNKKSWQFAILNFYWNSLTTCLISRRNWNWMELWGGRIRDKSS